MTTTTTQTQLVWVQLARDFHRSSCGRFDIVETAAGYWVAIDADLSPGVHRDSTFEACKRWCQQRADEGRE